MIDLTPILLAIINNIFPIVIAIVIYFINMRMKDQKAAAVLDSAVTNSLGAMQQSATSIVETFKPQINIPRITPQMAVGLQYVLDHAGDEAARFGVTQDAIVDKINAKIGLAKIADPATPTALPAVAVAAK